MGSTVGIKSTVGKGEEGHVPGRAICEVWFFAFCEMELVLLPPKQNGGQTERGEHWGASVTMPLIFVYLYFPKPFRMRGQSRSPRGLRAAACRSMPQSRPMPSVPQRRGLLLEANH